LSEAQTNSRTRHRIESLSDLIFGLALSIGALTLIGQQPKDFASLLTSVIYYAFSFLILITIWHSYTHTMSLMPSETTKLLNLNILLLFLVSIEPYLFNQLFSSISDSMRENVSIVYAFDLGILFLIQTFFANSLITEKKETLTKPTLEEFKFRRNIQLLSAVIFFVSVLPVFWSWQIKETGTNYLPVRFILWSATLFLPVFVSIRRRLRQRKESAQTTLAD
jgi:uncharacterized membrane protein